MVDELDVNGHLMDLIHWEFEEQQYLDLKPLKGLRTRWHAPPRRQRGASSPAQRKRSLTLSRDGARSATWSMSIRYRS